MRSIRLKQLLRDGKCQVATVDSVGQEMVLDTNSEHNVDLRGVEVEGLSGKTVTIISVPFIETVKDKRHHAHPHKKEFVYVKYKGQIYRVVNYFKP